MSLYAEYCHTSLSGYRPANCRDNLILSIKFSSPTYTDRLQRYTMYMIGGH